MDVLILSGELLTARPLTYGVMGHDTVTVEVNNSQLQALVDKFENPTTIPVEELDQAIKIASTQVIGEITRRDPDVVIATEFAGDVLAIMRSRGMWSGPSIIINPIGFYRQYPRLFKRHPDDPERHGEECMWITTSDFITSFRGNQRNQSARARGTMSVQVGALETLYQTRLLDGCISAVIAGS